MPFTTTDVNSYVAKAIRAVLSYIVTAVRLEKNGEDALPYYLKSRYLSAAIRNLRWTNNGFTNDEIEKIIHCMIECGDINDFSGDPITFPPVVILPQACCPTKLTDLTDGPMGTLVGQECKVLVIKCDTSGTQKWELRKVGFQGTVLFVSPDGDDLCGKPGDIMCHYATITAAQAAATDGSTIVIYPGTYSDHTLGKNGVRYHFYPGAIISSTADVNIFHLTSAMGAATIWVTGHGSFTLNATDASTYIFRADTTSSFIYAEVLDLTVGSSSRHAGCFPGVITLNGKSAYSTSDQSSFEFRGDGSIMTLDFTEDIIISTNNPAINLKNGLNGIMTVKARIIKSGSSGYATIYAENSVSSILKIDAFLITNSNASGISVAFGGGSTAIKRATINANIESITGNTFVVDTLGAGADITVNGRIYNSNGGNAVVCISTGSIVKVNGDIISDLSVPVSIVAGILRLRGNIYNNFNDPSGHGISKTGGVLVLEDVTIKITDTTAYAVEAVTAQDVIVYDARSNADIQNANVTYKVNSITLDPSVV